MKGLLNRIPDNDIVPFIIVSIIFFSIFAIAFSAIVATGLNGGFACHA